MKRVFAAVCAVMIFTAQTAVSLNVRAEKYDDVITAAFEYNARSRGAENFWSGLEFGKADWTALCYAKICGTEGADEYISSVKRSVKELYDSERFVKPTELQRASLVLSALGDFTEEAEVLVSAAAFYNEDLDRQGLNAWLWALTAANCFGEEPDGALNTKESLAEHILENQLPDGGFALIGDGADCDITSAAIYALAPLSFDNFRIEDALKRAADRLFELQLSSGGFYSMGTENCESTAQAIIALTSVGYGITDERVSAALDAVLTYRNDDGGFAHISGGKSNPAATAQAIEALVAVRLSDNGERLFDKSAAPAEPKDGTEIVIGQTPETTDPDLSLPPAESGGGLSGFEITLLISVVSGVLAIGMLIAALLKKKAFFLPAALSAAVSAGVWFVDIRSVEEYYAQENGHDITVTVSVSCETALSNMDKINEDINPVSVIPDDGVIIAKTETGLSNGDSAFDALASAARGERVRVDYIGSAYGLYVTAIGNIYEYGFGENSGWVYRVNGAVPDKSCGEYVLSDGDFLEFLYTCDLGRDLV